MSKTSSKQWRITNGWLDSATICRSPNFNDRPSALPINTLVIHNISLPPNQFGGGYIERFFCNKLDHSRHSYFEGIKGLEVSAHCLIARDGTITQFVSFDKRAWHAGQSHFNGRENCNDFSIGIELEGTDTTPYTAEQYSALTALTHALQYSYPAITTDNITGHCDIAPGRKTDPGPAFDWAQYRNGLNT